MIVWAYSDLLLKRLVDILKQGSLPDVGTLMQETSIDILEIIEIVTKLQDSGLREMLVRFGVVPLLQKYINLN